MSDNGRIWALCPECRSRNIMEVDDDLFECCDCHFEFDGDDMILVPAEQPGESDKVDAAKAYLGHLKNRDFTGDDVIFVDGKDDDGRSFGSREDASILSGDD